MLEHSLRSELAISFSNCKFYILSDFWPRIDWTMKNRLKQNGFANNVARNGIITTNSNKHHFVKSYRRIPKHRITTLQDHQVPAHSREPYIKSGYRYAENITVHQCLATLFTIHNETFNIWSHILASLAGILYAVSFFNKQQAIGNPEVYPLICFTICVIMTFLTSAFAHLFCCMSWKIRNACFYLDYASISVSTFSAGQAYLFYSRPLGADSSIVYQNPYVFLTISISLSVLNMFLSCLSRHRLLAYRFVIRTGLYVIKFYFDISPFVVRCLLTSDATCNDSTVFHFKRMFLLFAICGVVNAVRIPERLTPGFFDLFGHSHHIFHVLIALGNYDAFIGFSQDLQDRREELPMSSFQPTFFTTFGLHAMLMIVNSFILKWFVDNWLTTEEELFGSTQHINSNVIYRKASYENFDKKA